MEAFRKKFEGQANYRDFILNHVPTEYSGTEPWRKETKLRTADVMECIQNWEDEGGRGFLERQHQHLLGSPRRGSSHLPAMRPPLGGGRIRYFGRLPIGGHNTYSPDNAPTRAGLHPGL